MVAFRKRGRFAFLLVFTMLVYVAGVASASLVGDVLKIGGIGLLVSRFGGQINSAFNKIANLKESNTVKTKVVPVLSVGSGTSIGAVQVTGTRAEAGR